jgi:hypothetical protein
MWLMVDNVGRQRVAQGDVIVVTEGARDVAYFHVDRVDESVGESAR